MNTFDLQIQSTASDGTHAPRELVKMAKDRILRVIAITDHDTVDGVSDALTAGGEWGVRVIPGIEMSVEDHAAHLLGYGIDYRNEELLAALASFKEGRIAGAKQMAENLRRTGFIFEWEDVLARATGGVVARPHIARAIIGRPENKEKLGGIATVHDFIEMYLTDASPHYVKRAHIAARDAIALIHSARGVAAWSHPAIHFHDDYDGLEKFLNEMSGWGLKGIEVFNPSHTEDDTEFLNSCAIKYHLLRTGGSDFHEENMASRGGPGLHAARFVGDFETYGFPTDDVVEKLDEAIAAQKSS